MKNSSQANFTVIQHHKQQVQSFENIISKAYSAGLLTKHGELLIYGTGAERGTWGQFANVRIAGISFFNAKEGLTWFTDIYSKALRNKRTGGDRNRNFWLSQLQEIDPVLQFFGLDTEFDQKWSDIQAFDKWHDLPYEWEQKGQIHDWQNRTMMETITFVEREVEIMEVVTENLLKYDNATAILNSEGIIDHEDFIQEMFIEGLRGLTLVEDDIRDLIHSRYMLNRYRRSNRIALIA